MNIKKFLVLSVVLNVVLAAFLVYYVRARTEIDNTINHSILKDIESLTAIMENNVDGDMQYKRDCCVAINTNLTDYSWLNKKTDIDNLYRVAERFMREENNSQITGITDETKNVFIGIEKYLNSFLECGGDTVREKMKEFNEKYGNNQELFNLMSDLPADFEPVEEE